MLVICFLLQEVEELKLELETCESRLDSKYKAIDILRKQVSLTKRLTSTLCTYFSFNSTLLESAEGSRMTVEIIL